MNVQMAKVAGFCMGVRRAMDMALEASQKATHPVYTYGPLIHNPSALLVLQARKVEIIKEIPKKGHGTVIIRAHGVPPEDKTRLLAAGFKVVDATCPRVIKVQMLARHFARKGMKVILIGDEGHPEVLGILGHAGGQGILIADEEDLNDLISLAHLGDYIILAQTTQDRERFQDWSQRILQRFPGGRVFNTICDSTHKRQAEVRRLASEMDAVVVVGGKQSANTRRLAEIVEECGKTAIPVETEEDLDRESLSHFRRVGVTAGASTPNWVINRVVREIQALPGIHEPGWYRFVYRLVRFLHEANLVTALAGGALAWVTFHILNGFSPTSSLLIPPTSVAVAFCYIYAMHTLNRLIDKEAGEFNDPLRAKFLARHKASFITVSLAAIFLSLLLAWSIGLSAFIMLILLSVFGILYTIPILPGKRTTKSLKDLPGSKTLFVALAWSAVCVLAPLGVWPSAFSLPQWLLFLLVGILVYLRTALLEVLDVQGDRIVGKETLAVLIGEKKAVKLVAVLAGCLAGLSVALSLSGIISQQGMILALPAIYLIWLSKRFLGGRIGQNLKLETMVEASFFLLLIAHKFVHLLGVASG